MRKYGHMPPLTVSQLVERYGVSRRTVGRKIRTGELIPEAKLPRTTGAYLIDEAEAERVFGDLRRAS